MDLNELLYHHQAALIRAAELPDTCAHAAFDLARQHEANLFRHRLERGLAAYPLSTAGPRLGVS